MNFRKLNWMKRLLFGLVLTLFAFAAQAQTPIVYGVFFYSPTCSHCHEVIDNHWHRFQDEFGDQLQVLFIDVSTPQGSQIMRTATQAMNISSNGVPMLILGSNVFIGSVDIPQRAPGIIREGLTAGGIGYPPIPDVDVLFKQALGDSAGTVQKASILDDPANLLAIVILAGLVGNLSLVGWIVWRGRSATRRKPLISATFARWMIGIGVTIGIILSGSLLIGSFNDVLTLGLSAVVLMIFVALAYTLYAKPSLSLSQGWAIPLVIVAGLLVAGYLAYVETTLSEATCGAIGNCNAVQQSAYAQIFGIPIGVIGVVGYVLMLGVWVVDRYAKPRETAWVLFGMALVGVVFSIYLTFLEPFVIGSSCAWCLTSAVIMTLLLWLSLPDKALPVIVSKK